MTQLTLRIPELHLHGRASPDRVAFIPHYLDLARSGRVDLSGILPHTLRLDQWRDAFVALATQAESGAIKVGFG